MPYIEGAFVEPTNKDRAGWAVEALNAFAAETHYDEWNQRVHLPDEPDMDGSTEHLEEIGGDLLVDVFHLFTLYGVDVDQMIESARESWAFEQEEESDESATVADA